MLTGGLIPSAPPTACGAAEGLRGAQRTAQQLKRRCHLLTCDLEDTRLLLENQQSRNHDLEKKQKK